MKSKSVVDALRTRGINTSATHPESGILDFEQKGVPSALRISPHYYNTVSEVDELVDTIREIVAEART